MKKKRNITELIDMNRKTYNLVNDWIKVADQKIGVAFGILSALVSILLVSIIGELGIIKQENLVSFWWLFGALIVSLVLFVVGLSFYLKSLLPNLFFGENKNEYSIFFGKIAQFNSLEKFNEINSSISDEDYNLELENEILVNSKICLKKMKNFKKRTTISLIAVALLAILSILILIIK